MAGVDEAIRFWLFDFPQLEAHRPEDADDATDGAALFADFVVAAKIASVAEEICEGALPGPAGPPTSAGEAWTAIHALMRDTGLSVEDLDEAGVQTMEGRHRLLRALLCHALSGRCTRQRDYVGRIMASGRPDVQQEIMRILQENAPRGWKVKRFADGGFYVGEMKDGKRHGQGEFSYPNGAFYVGQWKDGNRHGQGKYTCANGSVYEGGWRNDNEHGQGKYTWAGGDVCEGEWKGGERHGKGKLTCANGSVYDGEFEDDKMHGQGKYTFASGAVYDGEFEDDKMHGQGKYTWANGRVHEGEWKEGQRHGNGKYTWADGSVDDGEWYCNQRHGDFIMTKATTGAKYGQIYHDGKLLRSNPVASRRRLTLEEDDITCQICYAEFSSDLDAADDNTRRRFPVLGSCGHCCCHGCVLEKQAAEARENSGRVPERINCMTCRAVGAFRPGEPTYFRVLADLIKRSTSVSE